MGRKWGFAPALKHRHPSHRQENEQLRADNESLRSENETLKAELSETRRLLQLQMAKDPSEITLEITPNSSSAKSEAEGSGVVKELAASLPSTSSDAFTRGSTSSAAPAGAMPSVDDIIAERRMSLGEIPIAINRADHITQGVLPLAAAFDRFDSDASGGISVSELRKALEYLGVENGAEQADAILEQYDKYPDRVLDVREFASLVRDVKLMIEFDSDGNGYLDADELVPALASLGLAVDKEQVEKILARFDVDASGHINLVELSSLVRTAQAFSRYDVDSSGTIDIDEMRDALRKLGIKAGALEEGALFRKYDADASGSIELHEFATLVRDLQLYASFDTNCDGAPTARAAS